MAVKPVNTNPNNKDLQPLISEPAFYVRMYGKDGRMPYSAPQDSLGFIKGSGSADPSEILGMGTNMGRFSIPSSDLIRTTGGIVLPKKSRKRSASVKTYISKGKKAKTTTSSKKKSKTSAASSPSKRKKSLNNLKKKVGASKKTQSRSYPIIH